MDGDGYSDCSLSGTWENYECDASVILTEESGIDFDTSMKDGYKVVKLDSFIFKPPSSQDAFEHIMDDYSPIPIPVVEIVL